MMSEMSFSATIMYVNSENYKNCEIFWENPFVSSNSNEIIRE